LDEVWRWKAEKGTGIVQDLRQLGCRLNWQREYFTMDEQQAHAVNVAFERLFDEGLIRRRNSLVNWSTATWTFRPTKADERETGPRDLEAPVMGEDGHLGLLFAGEASSRNHFSTVHGAVEAGWREADRLIRLYSTCGSKS